MYCKCNFFYFIFSMAPKTRQVKHCQQIAKDRHAAKVPVSPQPNPKMDTRLMVMNGLLTGSSYEGVKKQAEMMNTPTPSKRTFFTCQKQVLKEVISTVKEDCNKNAAKIKEKSNISVDGQWNHKRHGSYSTVSFFDQKQKKIVDYESISNGNYGQNQDVKSSNMETVGIEQGLNNIGSNIANKNINISHDHDNKTSNIIKKHKELGLTETFDPGHASQEIKRNANKYFTKYSRTLKDKKNPEKSTYIKCFAIFEKLIAKIIAWFQFLIFNVLDINQRERMWKNLTKHVIGEHKNCTHPSDLVGLRKVGRPKKFADKDSYWEWEQGKNNEEYQKVLDKFLDKNTPLLRQTGIVRTQDNESLNSMICRTIPKNKVFHTSNEARAAIAIGRKNDPHFESNILNKVCPGTIASPLLQQMKHDEEIKHLEKEKRKRPYDMKIKNETRTKSRLLNKNDKGDYQEKK